MKGDKSYNMIKKVCNKMIKEGKRLERENNKLKAELEKITGEKFTK